MLQSVKLHILLAGALITWGGLPQPAAAADINVLINGLLKTCANATTCALTNGDIPAGSSFTFVENAEVAIVVDDDASDILELRKIHIKAASDGAAGTITFWVTFAGGPNTDTVNPFAYFHEFKGKLGRGGGAAKDSEVWLTGYIQDDEIVGPYYKKVPCTVASCGVFDTYPTPLKEVWNTLNGNRVLKGKLQFALTKKEDLLKYEVSNSWFAQRIRSGPALRPEMAKDKAKEHMSVGTGVYLKRKQRTDCTIHYDPEGSCSTEWLEKQ